MLGGATTQPCNVAVPSAAVTSVGAVTFCPSMIPLASAGPTAPAPVSQANRLSAPAASSPGVVRNACQSPVLAALVGWDCVAGAVETRAIEELTRPMTVIEEAPVTHAQRDILARLLVDRLSALFHPRDVARGVLCRRSAGRWRTDGSRHGRILRQRARRCRVGGGRSCRSGLTGGLLIVWRVLCGRSKGLL